jgi:hypothetical protein
MLIDRQLYALYRSVYRRFDEARSGLVVLTSALPPLARAVAQLAELDVHDGASMRTYLDFQRALAQGEGALAALAATPARPAHRRAPRSCRR